MTALTGTRTASICDVIKLPDHMALLEGYLNEPTRIHQARTTKLSEVTAHQRGEWQVAHDDLKAEEARMYLAINEIASDGGKGAAAAEALRVANVALAQAKEQLETHRSRLLLQVFNEVGADSKPRYANDKLRDAALLVEQDKDQRYKDAAVAYRAAEEAVSAAKTAADAQVIKPKYSNEAARSAAMVQLQQTDLVYKTALDKFRRADQRLQDLKTEADDFQQQIANVSATLWGLREMVKGDAAVLLAVASLDAPKLPVEIPLRVIGSLPTVIELIAPESMPAVPLQAPDEPLKVVVNVARGAA